MKMPSFIGSLALCLTASNLLFAEGEKTLSSIEKQAIQIEQELKQLENKIASFETDAVSDDRLEQPIALNEKSSNLPLTSSEQSFLIAQETTPQELLKETMAEEKSVFRVDLRQAFSGSPIIYSILGFLSMFSFAMWCYSMLKMKRKMRPKKEMLEAVKNKLIVNQYEEASKLLEEEPHVLSKMLLSLLEMRALGYSAMMEAMRAEGKRATLTFWQKLHLLSDVAIVAPMLGLLGTVLGMFYAFYDINRSIESITTLFDGLGISVGTTVAGLIVALFAMVFHSLAKFRLVRELAIVENEAQSFVPLIAPKQ